MPVHHTSASTLPARRWSRRAAGTALALALVLFFPACGQMLSWPAVKERIREEFPAVRQMSTAQLAARLAGEGADLVLLDVREEEEFTVSHLPGAIRIDPEAGLEALPPDLAKDAPIVAYCAVGYRSSALVEQMMAAGFSDVANLEGSIFTWANEGRPIVRAATTVHQVHPYNRFWGRLLNASLHADAPPH